ncbi:MAG: hypothetical protein A4E57_00133 [Syntrophorhabdaceae bacterium PtaU1.Bin034]|jgi:hypothetical protein|nr:MAG: hypothetical protein A4E57_00133 [Syntrophorhabdaceae bacterium PtaU1.Bin034]
MKWIEVIRLRSEPAKESEAAAWLSHAARELAGEKHLATSTVCSRVDIAGDIALYLEWDVAPPSVHGSDAGLRIAHALRGFGLVDQSVWAETTNSKILETEGTQPVKKRDESPVVGKAGKKT